MTAPTDPSQQLAELSDELLATMSSADPFTASIIHGVPGYDAQVSDLSESGQLSTAERLRSLADRAERIPADSLDDDDRVTRAVLPHVARSTASPLQDRHAEFSVSGYASPTGLLFAALSGVDLVTPESERDYLDRVRGVPGYLAQARERALTGVAAGRVPTRRAVEQTVEQLSTYLRAPLDDDLIVATARGTGIEEKVRALVADAVRPAVTALVETMSDTVLAAARPDADSGLLHLPDGPEMYVRAVEAHTSTTRSPEEIHALGLELCASLREEFAQLGRKVFGTGDTDTVIERLRHDPALRYSAPHQLVDDAQAAMARAEGVIDRWFGRTYSVPCTVVPMNEVVAPTSVIGEYIPAGTDESRGPRYNINTYQPHTRTRYEYEALAFHESVPGHHLQFALAQELDHLPDFRRFLYVTAFGEGWGLYAERLADEMGLYSSDLYRFGMVSFDAWRACRLVVDTGMHHYGWSRQQAIDFMLANSALTPENIVNEVDRYIAWPGQALAYMCGRLEIDRLRSAARDRLGSGFDLRGFHDAVLGNGSVPLGVLASEIDRWIDRQDPASTVTDSWVVGRG